MVDHQRDPVALVDSRYDAWREAFAAERDRVRDALDAAGLAASVERIEHVGSTAVPGLAAKDIVDVDVVVVDDAVSDVSRVLAADLGGTRYRNHDGWHPVFREHDGQRFNDHVFATSDDGWRTSVATRDVLRVDDAFRETYERVKRDLAAEHDDVDAYSRGKTAIVEDVLERARGADDLGFDFDVPR
jgi:GrpB-like predicted nucleotidyltransferase (UPF0157 family)